MRLLLNLVNSLTQEEAGKLTALSLRGKQRALMDLVMTSRQTGIEPAADDVVLLGFSKSHLYEATSVLLSKCQQCLIPGGGIALLEFLTYKNLHLLFKQELRKQQKQIDPKAKETEIFYLNVFELLTRFSYNFIDKELVAQYGKCYLEAKKNPTPEDALAIETKLLQIKLTDILAEGKNFGKEQEATFAKLTELEKAARISDHSYLCFIVYSSFAWYWQHLGGKPDMSLRAIQRAVPYASKLEGFVFREMPQEIQLRLADAHFHLGGSVEALEIFDRVYSFASDSSIVWKRNYFLFRYLEVLIYNGRYLRAEQILTKYFEPSFGLPGTSASASAATLFCILYLFSDNYSKAAHYLSISMKLNVKTNFTLYNEVRNRYIETILAYLTGDWTYAHTLNDRAVQYLYGKGIGLNNNKFGYYFKIVDSIIIYYSQGKPFRKKIEDKYKELTVPNEGLFGLLLKKIRATSKEKTISLRRNQASKEEKSVK
jgi:hypothetical protein